MHRSAAHLGRTPPYQKFYKAHIEIAQEFVRDIESDANNRAIIKATIAMAQSLGSEIIAEGVETREQLSFLLSLGGCRA